MNKLSQMATASLASRSDEPALEFEGRSYSWNEPVALADKLTALINATMEVVTA